MELLIRWAIIAISLVVAVVLVPGIRVEGDAFVAVIVTAAVLGLLNVFLKPALRFLTCGCIVATLGLFLLVINGFILWLASYISSDLLGLGFYVQGFWPAFWGGLVVSVVSFVLSLFTRRDDSRR